MNPNYGYGYGNDPYNQGYYVNYSLYRTIKAIQIIMILMVLNQGIIMDLDIITMAKEVMVIILGIITIVGNVHSV